jgi:CO dehydrogenase/acetyl-CoA synthase delta subunit
MGQNLNKEDIEKIIAEELVELVGDYNIDIEDINVDVEGSKVHVTFGLHTVPQDNYIGLSFY